MAVGVLRADGAVEVPDGVLDAAVLRHLPADGLLLRAFVPPVCAARVLPSTFDFQTPSSL